MDIFSGDNLIILIKTVGYLGIFGIVFAESGIMVGFMLPGDSLLFTAGFLASQGFLNIFVLVPLIFFGAILGDNFGYYLGHKLGKKVFTEERKNKFLKKENLDKAEEFYKKHGIKTMLFARFIPFVRTLAPLSAGAGKMDYKKFLFFDVIGAFLWSSLVTLAGFFLGNIVPDIDRYILPIIILIVVVSLFPSVGVFIRAKIIKFLIKKRSLK
ncbi:MAG TPA: DedA family protein [Patescibacteria group bacterium]|nr:DedA family protein [Patescibacteria group bacterium]